MSVIKKGAPPVFGIGSGAAKLIKSGDSAETTVYLQNVQVQFSADSVEMNDGNGEVVGKVYYNQKRTLTMTAFVSHGSTIAGAETAFESDIAEGDKLIVSYDEWEEVASDDANTLTGTPAAGEGQWVVDTATKTRSNGQIAEWSVTAIMYANDLTDDAT